MLRSSARQKKGKAKWGVSVGAQVGSIQDASFLSKTKKGKSKNGEFFLAKNVETLAGSLY